jgi:hypothetical protein
MNDVRPRVAIAGAGVAGLRCATELAHRVECHVFDSLPLPASEVPGTSFLGDTRVLRFRAGRLLALGRHTTAAPYSALVVATGHRPLTRTELRIDGAPCGGILPATVAEHLLDHGLDLGQVVVVGDAAALGLAQRLLARPGRQVALLLPDGPAGPVSGSPRLAVHDGLHPLELRGWPRVERILAGPKDGPVRLELACETVILAYGRVPHRTIEGATGPAPGVVFAQAGGGMPDGEESRAAGATAAASVLEFLGGGKDWPGAGS